MAETSPPYGDQPVIPSTRVTEAELLEYEHDDPLALGPMDGVKPRLVAALRRYRALLLGLATFAERDEPIADTADASSEQYGIICPLSGCVPTTGRHIEGCPWAELEAEVQAIRAER